MSKERNKNMMEMFQADFFELETLTEKTESDLKGENPEQNQLDAFRAAQEKAMAGLRYFSAVIEGFGARVSVGLQSTNAKRYALEAGFNPEKELDKETEIS